MAKIYVGNIPFKTTEEELKEHFSPIGEVHSIKIIKDHETGFSRGYCFIEMENVEKAIQELNGKSFQGRYLKISEAIEKPRPNFNSDNPPVNGNTGRPQFNRYPEEKRPSTERPQFNSYPNERPKFDRYSDNWRKKGFNEERRYRKERQFDDAGH